MSHHAARPISRQPPCRPAFTLVELLVVISVIAVLAAMLMPAIGLVKANAVQATCGKHQSQFMAAFTAYSTDNEGYLPPRIYLNGVDPSYSNQDTDYFLSYFDNLATTWNSNGKGSLYAFGNMNLRCPTVYEWWKPNAVAMGFVTDYSSGNTGLIKSSEASTQFGVNGDLLPPYKTSAQVTSATVKGPSAAAILFCGNNHFNLSFNAGTAGRYVTGGDNGVEWPQFPHKARTTRSWSTQSGASMPLTAPVDGGTNVAFLDGHIELRRPQEEAAFAAVVDGGVPLVTTTGVPSASSAPLWNQFWKGR